MYVTNLTGTALFPPLAAHVLFSAGNCYILTVLQCGASRFFMSEETASGFEGARRRRHMSPVPNARLARFFNFAKKSRRVTLADSFFMGRESASGFEGTRRLRHMPSVPTARLARFFRNLFPQNNYCTRTKKSDKMKLCT